MTNLSARPELRRAFVFALAILAAACQTAPTVTSDTAPGAKVDAYRTFGFVEQPSTDAPAYTTLTTQSFKDAITRQMVARGYEFSTEPELLVNFDVAVSSEEKKKGGGGVSVGMGGASGGSGSSRAAGVGVNLGNLFGSKGVESVVRVDVVDRQQKQMVWGGSVTQHVPADQKEYSQALIDKAVTDIFAKYPKAVVATAPAPGSVEQAPR